VLATSLGHAGILIECEAGSILCDPWFEPAFLGSWFVFPRNDQLDEQLLDRIENADYLYVSHLHGDHHDAHWLQHHLRRDIPILLPDYPTSEQRREFEQMGFSNFISTEDGVEQVLCDGLTIAIHVETSITDGPGGDSAIVVSDGKHRIVNQNDCRTHDLAALRSHGPVDLHWLQYSGAIWYPMVYELTTSEMAELCAAKVESQGARALKYVDALDARCVVPSAGPPAFLDDGLFHLNMISGDEASIFPDQRWFLEQLSQAGKNGLLAIPGSTISVTDDEISVTHPMPERDVEAIFDDKRSYLQRYRSDWQPWLDDLHQSWQREPTDLVARVAAWWEPLLAKAPTVSELIGEPILIRGTNADGSSVEIFIDVRSKKVLDGSTIENASSKAGFRFTFPRDLLELTVDNGAVDWSNSLLLSCRFTAWRKGPYNEYVYNLLKSLSVERMTRTEAEARAKVEASTANIVEDDVEVGDFIVQRRCPHRNADFSVFGEIDGADLVCTLHGWRFDTATGRCRTSDDHPVRIRRQGT
jgi:UDP-MurNAc hydroxylase